MGRRHSLATIWGAVLAAGLGALTYAAESFDWINWGVNFWNAALPSITIVVLHFARLLIIQIPKSMLPIAGVVIATIGERLHTLAQSGDFNMLVVAIVAGVADICYTIAKEAVGDAA